MPTNTRTPHRSSNITNLCAHLQISSIFKAILVLLLFQHTLEPRCFCWASEEERALLPQSPGQPHTPAREETSAESSRHRNLSVSTAGAVTVPVGGGNFILELP